MSKTAKSVISCLVVVLIFTSLVGVLGFASKGFKDWNTKNWFQKEQVVEKPVTPPAVTDGDGNDMTGGQVYDMPANMVFGSASPASVGNAITINAVVTPANASIKDLTWAINWQNPASTWATGKVITDYFTLTPNGQQSSISCLQAFGEKIVISVTSVDNPAAKAECVVDFARRLESCDLVLKNSSGDIVSGSYYQLDVLSNDTQKFIPEVTFSEGVGTISGIKTFDFHLVPSLFFVQLDVIKNTSSVPFDINGMVFDKSFFSKLLGAEQMVGNNLHIFNQMLKCQDFSSFQALTHCTCDANVFDAWRMQHDLFDIKVAVSDSFSNKYCFDFVIFGLSSFYDYIAVNSVSLSNNSLQF